VSVGVSGLRGVLGAHAPSPSVIHTLSLHDALPISLREYMIYVDTVRAYAKEMPFQEAVDRAISECISTGILADFLSRNQAEVKRSEEHTSELQSRFDLVCRLLLEKKKCSAADASPS